MRTEDLLEQINAAVGDWETSPDAVRFNAPSTVCEVCGVDHSTLPIDGHQGGFDDGMVIAAGFDGARSQDHHVAMAYMPEGSTEWVYLPHVVILDVQPFQFQTQQDREFLELESRVEGWQMPEPGTVVLSVTIDIEPFQSALLDLYFGGDRRLRYGRRNLDPITDSWQSDMCAAWLCGSCPLPERCDHKCHAKAARR